mmetsp:Transcript_8294/g.23875  ORF Transcript_8294/g.23875 Transcript_8294/m.23875 type:complete len:174 (-) Transcript_8294:1020-1541(-)
MSSNDLPFVSGNSVNTNTATSKQLTARTKKKPAQPIAFAKDKKVDAMKVAEIRLEKDATLIALARTLVGKTSDGINQAPGPIPMLKNARYIANPPIAIFASEGPIPPTKALPTITNARNIPPNDASRSGRLPRTSKSLPPTKMNNNLMTPSSMRISRRCFVDSTPAFSSTSFK